MGAIASGGDGTLAFIDDPKQLPDLYANELSGLTNTSAQRISLGIRTRNGAELNDVLNDLPQTAFGNWQLPNLRFGKELHVAVKIELPAWTANADIASLRLAWEQPGESERHSQVEMLSLPVMPAAEIAEMEVDPVVAEQFALLQANRDRQRAIEAIDADDLEGAEQCLTAIDESLASMPCSAAINTERHAIQQRRAMLHQDRNRSRKNLRREALRSSVNVWEESEDSPN